MIKRNNVQEDPRCVCKDKQKEWLLQERGRKVLSLREVCEPIVAGQGYTTQKERESVCVCVCLSERDREEVHS